MIKKSDILQIFLVQTCIYMMWISVVLIRDLALTLLPWTLEETLLLGKIGSKRRRGQRRMRWLESITDSMGMNLSKLQKRVEDRGDWQAAVPGSQRVGHD